MHTQGTSTFRHQRGISVIHNYGVIVSVIQCVPRSCVSHLRTLFSVYLNPVRRLLILFSVYHNRTGCDYGNPKGSVNLLQCLLQLREVSLYCITRYLLVLFIAIRRYLLAFTSVSASMPRWFTRHSNSVKELISLCKLSSQVTLLILCAYKTVDRTQPCSCWWLFCEVLAFGFYKNWLLVVMDNGRESFPYPSWR